MELYEKPPVQKDRRNTNCFIALVLLAFCLYGLWGSWDACCRYAAVKDKAVTVTARISRVEEHYDDDDGHEYDVYIQYEYGGSSYEAQYKNDTGSSSWKRRIGSHVQVQINPERPSELISQLLKEAHLFVFVQVFLGMAINFLSLPVRRSWTELHGISSEPVKQDLLQSIHRRWLWKWGLSSGVIQLAFKLIFFEVVNSWVLLLSAVVLILGLKGALCWRRDLEKVHSGAYAVRPITIVDKSESSRRNGGTRYRVTFSDGMERWSQRVTGWEYQCVECGEQRKAAYLEDERRPELVLLLGDPVLF